jgi:RNA polymerase-binding transcription factor DksA
MNSAHSTPRVPQRWKWHQHVLTTLRDQLINECNDRRHDAAQSEEPMDFAESGTENFDHERALSELRSEEDALGEVNAALGRIEKDIYGVCEKTGRRIGTARLRALPWTRYCKQVQARLEATKAKRAPSS